MLELTLNVVFQEEAPFVCDLEENDSFEVDFGEKYTPPIYNGPSEVDPSQSTQVLETSGKMLLTNITVNPLPSYYGLITWNGSVLTVS